MELLKLRINKLPPKLQAKITSHPTLTEIEQISIFPNIDYENEMKKIKQPLELNPFSMWRKNLIPISDQKKCGSCWCFATTACLAERFNIWSKGKIHIELSTAKMLLCDFYETGKGDELELAEKTQNLVLLQSLMEEGRAEAGCGGNTLQNAWRYLYLFGTNSNKCIPYNLRKDWDKPSGDAEIEDELPLCTDISGLHMDMCMDYDLDESGVETGTPARFWRCITYYAIRGTEKQNGNIENLEKELFKNGPITTGMIVYPSFYEFDPKIEIYAPKGDEVMIGGHAIVIEGYGEEDGVKYWWIRNSFGDDWGVRGYFRMIRGENVCGIEENCIAPIPDLFFPSELGLKIMKEIRLPEEWEDRYEIDIGENVNGGGIDPTTGMSRRTMSTKPWYDFEPIFSIKTEKEWGKLKRNKPRKSYMFIFLFILLVIVCVIFAIYIFKEIILFIK